MLPWLLCGALALLSLLLLVRLAALHRSLDELRAFFAQNIAEESNGLIRLSSRDPYVRRCASGLNAALRELPRQAQRELDAVREAIVTTRQYRNGEHHVRLIELMYWRGRSNVSMINAADEIPIALVTARAWHNDFVKLVDAYLRIL